MKKKILFITESLAGGGAEKVLAVLLKHFDYQKYEVTVCPIVDAGVYCDEVKQYVNHYKPVVTYNGNRFSILWNKIKYKLVYSWLPLSWVYKLFIPQGNDIEIAFCEGFDTKLLSKAKSNSRKIAWIHTDLTDNPWPIQLGVFKDESEEKQAYSVFDKIVTVSKTVEKSFNKKYGMLDKTCTIYNPIDIEDIRQKAGDKTNKQHETFKIISVGRLVPQKGYDRLLIAVKRLHDEGNDISLLLLGEGEERQKLESYIEENNMSAFVSLPGFCSNPYKEMINSDLFVCSSRAEGFSLVIAEAMALGVPVLSTYCSGPNELLDEGENGVLVPNSNESLYQGLKSTLQNGLKYELAQNSMQKIEEFSPCSILKSIENIICVV